MNYIELINWFWTLDETYEFTPTETRLYMYLLKVGNSLSWPVEFWHSEQKTSIGASVSVNSMRAARKKLIQANLINYEKGGKGYGDKSRYQILTPKEESGVFSSQNLIPKVVNEEVSSQILTPKTENDSLSSQNLTPKTEENGENDEFRVRVSSQNLTPIIKLNNNNTTKKKNKKKNEDELIFPFSSQKFTDAWLDLMKMPKWSKKIPHSLQLALKSLGKYDEEFAVELIERAIEGNWQGVTFPNTPDDYERWKRRKGGQNGRNQQIIESVARKQHFAERIEQLASEQNK